MLHLLGTSFIFVLLINLGAPDSLSFGISSNGVEVSACEGGISCALSNLSPGIITAIVIGCVLAVASCCCCCCYCCWPNKEQREVVVQQQPQRPIINIINPSLPPTVAIRQNDPNPGYGNDRELLLPNWGYRGAAK